MYFALVCYVTVLFVTANTFTVHTHHARERTRVRTQSFSSHFLLSFRASWSFLMVGLFVLSISPSHPYHHSWCAWKQVQKWIFALHSSCESFPLPSLHDCLVFFCKVLFVTLWVRRFLQTTVVKGEARTALVFILLSNCLSRQHNVVVSLQVFFNCILFPVSFVPPTKCHFSYSSDDKTFPVNM